jgi:rod shape-determining protein MreC
MLRRQTFSVLVAACVMHVLLISSQVQSRSGVPVITSVAFSLLSRLQGLTNGVVDTGRNIWTHYVSLHRATVENDALRQRILDLEGEVQRERALAGRTQSLEEALALKASQPAPMLAARVLSGNPSPSILTVTIDRGTDDGITPDMAVISARGIVGRIISPVGRHSATVQLLVGRNAAAAVVFEHSKAGGMVVGGINQALLRAEYVPVLADVQKGERVTTSGQDGIYPQGFLAGTVEEVTHPGAAADREITVRPAVDFSHIETVLIVLSRPKAAGTP